MPKQFKIHFSYLSLMSLTLLLVGLQACTRSKGVEQDDIRTPDSTTLASHDTIPSEPSWVAPDTAYLSHEGLGKLIRYGRELVANTGFYLGPHGKVKPMSNGMNCQNCHLDAGTKLFANSYSAVYSNYPKFRPRSGTVEDIQKRINDCMERSLNGKKLDKNSREMIALVAYINWVGKDVPKNTSPKGASVVDLPWMDRAADPDRGKVSFQATCVRCHGEDGQGKLNPDSITYQYPPLWGPKSYNTAAGLYRLSRVAGYIKSNMPFQESTHDRPKLLDEEAWDIAAYICSQPRPEKKFKADWPDISKKPVDFPFGPYADSYSEQQHKYGPFKDIIAATSKK